MTATINASTTAGVVTTADTSGILQLQTNGTAALTVDASQNVGIGTASPANKFQVVASTSGTNDLVTISRFDRGSSGTAANGLGGRLEFSAQDNAGSQRTAAFLNWGLASVASGSPTGFLSLSTRGTDPALYIDNSGNVGIGTSSPSYKLSIAGGSATSSNLLLTHNTDATGAYSRIRFQFAEGNTSIASEIRNIQRAGGANGSNLAFFTENNSGTLGEAARIDTSGNLLVGTTNANAKLHVAVTSATNPINANVNYTSSTNISGIRVTKFDNNTTTAQRFIEFVIDAGATGCGQINANGASAAAFGSYSDSRLKENITNLPSQLANIMALRPVEFDYIQSEGGGHQIGFIAQEVNEVYPDLVGERADGMFTLTDLNKNDARLIKAIQELKAIVDAQGAEIAALKGATA